MKSLYESLVIEDWDPESYGGAAQGAGFYVQADHKDGYTAGGELDIKIQGQKITIKEKKSVGDKAHRVEVDIEKPGTYNFDIQADCDISLYIYSEKAVKGINIATSGKPIANLFMDCKKCQVVNLSEADICYFDFDGQTKLQELIGPTAKECGFRIAKCPNLESVDLSGIVSTPTNGGTGRLYIRNCKKLSTIRPPQAVGMDVNLEKLPALSAAAAKVIADVATKSGYKCFDFDKQRSA